MGKGDMSDIDMLEYVLEVLYGRKKPELAHRLCERFGDIPGIFRATREELASVEGVTERVAVFFSGLLPLERQALLRKSSGAVMDSESALVKYGSMLFLGSAVHAHALLYLDEHGRILAADIAPGSAGVREAVSGACRHRAASVAALFFAPRTDAKAAVGKLKAFADIVEALELIDVGFTDAIELSPNGFIGARRLYRGNISPVEQSKASASPYAAATACSGELVRCLRGL